MASMVATPAGNGSVEQIEWNERFSDVCKLVSRPGARVGEGFEPDAATIHALSSINVLVVGAGGLGCELLKSLSLSGIRSISVIDLDSVDTSNLNRQFLFKEPDVGRPKATVAAERVNERVQTACVTGYACKVEELSTEWLASFDICCLGLDSIEARAHVNAVLCGVAEYDDEGNIAGNIVPMVDGGTEGFKGHARLIVPGITPCFQCTRWLFPPQESYPLCTLAETPRNPAHCIEYAHLILWQNERADEKFDSDNAEHIGWVYNKAAERAKAFGIEGVTYSKTQGVVKNIVPAVPSTNAIVASVCALEAVKLATSFCQSMQNYTMYMGTESVYTHTAPYERDPECIVCSAGVPLQTQPDASLRAVLERVRKNYSLEGPSSVTYGSKRLYMAGMFHEETKHNLDKHVSELLGSSSGGRIILTDIKLTAPLRIRVEYSRADR